VAELGGIGAGAEAGSLALEQDHLDAVVDLRLADEVADPLERGHRQRVHLVGPVEDDGGELAVRIDLVADVPLERLRIRLHVLRVPLACQELGLGLLHENALLSELHTARSERRI
jgi:hypothetical protein